MTMRELTYQVSFNTPAFLGNAEQQAQWRTPPFKALLRQWWRVVKAPEVGYDRRTLLALENVLFGSAGDDSGGGRSKVQLRLSSWSGGTVASVPKGEMVRHDEAPGHQVGANLYLGYGPIGGQSRNAIAPLRDVNTLTIRGEEKHVQEIKKALQLAAWFGTIGSRSRNGWGSIHFDGPDIQGFADLRTSAVTAFVESRPLDACLRLEWRNSMGCDAAGIPLIWRLLKVGPPNEKGQGTLISFGTWDDVMQELARIKIKVRTSDFFKFTGGGRDGHPDPLPRHVLSYPTGNNHKVTAKNWDTNGRLANQVLFKVHKRSNGFAATIAHFPARVPEHMSAGLRLPNQTSVWKEVHRLLDAEKSQGLIRIKGIQA